MRYCSFLIIAGISFCSSGCFSTVDSNSGELAESKPAGAHSAESTFSQAIQQETRGRYVNAVKLFSIVVAATDSVELFRKANLGKARCLMLDGKNKLALAALAPLPETPRQLYDARRLVLAARILCAMNRCQNAEPLLEVALDKDYKTPQQKLLKAQAFAFLGKVYLKNRKSQPASVVFAHAAKLYIECGYPDKAKTCMEINRYLQ
ncbi:hypothetical protein P0136_09190 [Lentisphaerota bacterium ZTH]|nr:hypothetical protein JYG24_13300 [Lentisphaerota bacterium]WET05537.1 hypothetical protein P0136_09190 [Lentisphaerota bacterium ZTH]